MLWYQIFIQYNKIAKSENCIKCHRQTILFNVYNSRGKKSFIRHLSLQRSYFINIIAIFINGISLKYSKSFVVEYHFYMWYSWPNITIILI